MKKILFMGLISLITSCCTKICSTKDDFLTIPKTSYFGSELRIDGYYYQTWEDKKDGTQFCDILFFYNNGVVFQRGGGGNLSELNEVANNSYFSNTVMDKKGFWGVFKIENDKIIIERWIGTQSGYSVYRDEGNIINDTSFVITERSRIKHGVQSETKSIRWNYYFKEFSPKPDSTNIVIN